jgi:predicted DCC family thiol-disulfide oxidoreductase YuxK
MKTDDTRAADQPEILLVYDRKCPVCDAYCRLVRIGEPMGALRLVNARDAGAVMDEITAKGLDIDRGMVLKGGNAMFHGAEAMHVLALMSSRAGAFNRVNYRLFRSGMVARALYPALRLFRNLLLKALRRTKVNHLGLPGNERF